MSIRLFEDKIIDKSGKFVKMAAHSGGVDWAAIAKPILSSNYGNLSKTDVLNIIKAILRRYVSNFSP